MPEPRVRTYGSKPCPWCHRPDLEDYDENHLCRPHRAEFHGLSLAALDVMEGVQDAEYADTLG